MKRLVATLVVFSIYPGAASSLRAQPILDRLEQSIRSQLAQPDGRRGAAESPAGEQPHRATTAQPPANAAQPAGHEPGHLGVVADDKNDRGRGVRILDVRPGGPADRAGLRKQDLVTAVAGVSVKQMADMAEVLDLFPAGDTLDIEVLRDDRQLNLKVTLGRRPGAVPPPPGSGAETPVPPAAPVANGAPRPGPPGAVNRPPQFETLIERLSLRIEQLERRVAELEKALAEAEKKP